MKPFIAETEILLPLVRTNAGNEYGETTFLNRLYSLDMLLDEPGDSCFQILKINVRTKETVDVTEAFAAAWLKRFEEDQEKAGFTVRREDERSFPDYVKDSSAWADMIEEIELRQPLSRANRYNTLRNRLAAYLDAGRPADREHAGAANV